MYLHIGQNEILPDRRVIGIFDLDKCSYGKRTREYLAAAEKEGIYDTGKPSPLFILVHIPGDRNSGALSGGSVHGAAGPAAKLQQAPETAGPARCFWCTVRSFCCCILPGWRCSPPSWLC